MFQSQSLAFRSVHLLVSCSILGVALLASVPPFAGAAEPGIVFRAGAYAMDVTPTNFPVLVNGGFFTRTAHQASDQLHARCLVLDDGATRVGLCVLDTCVIPRELADVAKREIQKATGLAPERVMISATHTHAAPSLMSAHGVDADPHYPDFLLPLIAEGFRRAVSNLAPAEVGWGVVSAPEQTHTRVWVWRPDRMRTDPFGERTVRANMHPGHQNPDAIAPTGPRDPDLSFLAVRTPQGRPMALLANYSMHYHGGVKPVSADYYGRYCDRLSEFLGASEGKPAFVGIMSQGTSGDSQWMDYSKPRRNISVDAYAEGLARATEEAYRHVRWRKTLSLEMRDRDLTLATRQPSPERLAWAENVVKRLDGRPPKSLGEIYAREQLWLRDHPTRPVKLQALRVGELGIVMNSAEVFAISGLKIKAQSPLQPTFFIELANGEDGYIPPPEHHPLGSYNTWACRTAGLEEAAENKIVEGLLELLEEVSGKPRRPIIETHGPYAQAVIKAKPLAYWRMNDFDGREAIDVTHYQRRAMSEDGVVFYLPGPQSSAFSGSNQVNRAFHFAGGRMRAAASELGPSYTVEFWFWNGLDDSARAVTGYLFSRGTDGVYGAPGDHLAIGGTRLGRGRLVFSNGGGDTSTALVGQTKLARNEWHHVALVRDGKGVLVYLNGNPLPEISGQVDAAVEGSNGREVFFGGRSDNEANFEGKLDEIALYDRVLSVDEIGQHFELSGIAPPSVSNVAEEMPLSTGPASVVHSLKPAAHWLVPASDGESLVDLAGENEVVAESGVELPGAARSAAGFSGGRLKAKVAGLGTDYSVTFWFFNELPNTARPVTAYLFSRGKDGDKKALADNLGLGGTAGKSGRLFVFNGHQHDQVVTGRTTVTPNAWHHVVFIREGGRVRVFLDRALDPEIDETLKPGYDASVVDVYFGARNDKFAPLRGKLSDVAIFRRVLTDKEIERIQRSAALPAKAPVSRAEPQPEVLPLSAQASLAALHVRDGFTVELVASEPLVRDPVAIDWGPDGRLWVAEMADYPLGVDGKGKAGGRVRVLEDTDGDGRYDKSVVFLEGVNHPTGLLTWRDGVLVTAAPEIFFAADRDGDGRADERRVLYKGFKEGNAQLRVNGLRWGLDNWVYCAASWSGGEAESVATGARFGLKGRDLRIRPDEGLLDSQSGVSQFGRNRNDWGDWFGVNNSFPIWHFAFPDHYSRRNPFVAPPNPIIKLTGQNPKVYPAKPPQKRFHSFNQSGRFTSACSTMIYRDELLFGRSPAGEQHSFVCEPFHNLVQRRVVMDDGLTFKSARATGEEQSEFFASEDRWCRPVMTRTGPDGALWVVDMYRYMIEHPAFLTPEGKAELMPFYRLGEDRGRIYRVFPTERRPRPIPNLVSLSTPDLVAALESPNGWQRDKVQQILLWRADREAVRPLVRLAKGSHLPEARLHALCTLEGLSALSARIVKQALNDEHAGVRRYAVRLAESMADDVPGLLGPVSKLINDPALKVRQQVAFSLGAWDGSAAGEALGRLLTSHAADPYLRGAVLSSGTNHTAAVVRAAVSSDDDAVVDATLNPLAAIALGMGQEEAFGLLTERALRRGGDGYTALHFRRLTQLLDQVEKQKLSVKGLDPGVFGRRSMLSASKVFVVARQYARDSESAEDQRAQAVALLGREPARFDEDLSVLGSLLSPRSPAVVQRAAVKALSKTRHANVPELFFRSLTASGPELRVAIVDELLGNEDWTLLFLEQIQKGDLTEVTLNAARRGRLLKHKSKAIREAAEKSLQTSINPDRQKVIQRYRSALTLTGKVDDGARVFQQLCSACHKMGEVGREIGVNLASVSGHPPEKLLISILDPSRELEPRFVAYTCTLTDDEEIYGIITSETTASLEMTLLDGTRRTVLRDEIKSLQSSRGSLMPTGLEAGLTPQQMADLIQFLKSPSRVAASSQ